MAVVSMCLFVGALVWLQRWLYRRFWTRNLSARLSFSAREAFEGEQLVLSEEVTNAKILPLPWVAVGFQVSRNLVFPGQTNAQISDDYYQSDLFSISMFEKITRQLPFFCGRRGYYRIKEVSLSSNNLFLSDRLVRKQSCGEELTVFPKLIAGPELEALCRRLQGEVEVRRFTCPDPFAFRGIRDYLPGDAFRSINFQAAAKTGRLMVNVNSATADQQVVILLNLEPYTEWVSEDIWEEGIRLAASLAEHFLGLGMQVGVRTNGLDLVTRSPLRVLEGSGHSHLLEILRTLARVDLAARVEPISGLLGELRQPEPTYLLVSSYCGEDLCQAVGALESQGMSVRWILPAFAETRITLDEARFLRWEVKPYDAPATVYQKMVG